MAWPVRSRYLIQCGNIFNWTFGNTLQWNITGNLHIFIKENALENVVWENNQFYSWNLALGIDIHYPWSVNCDTSLHQPWIIPLFFRLAPMDLSVVALTTHSVPMQTESRIIGWYSCLAVPGALWVSRHHKYRPLSNIVIVYDAKSFYLNKMHLRMTTTEWQRAIYSISSIA